MILPVYIFFKVKDPHWYRLWTIGQPHQDVRQDEADVAGVLRLPERLPFGVLWVGICIEDLGQVAGHAEICEAVQVKEVGACGRNERCMGSSGHVRDLLE